MRRTPQIATGSRTAGTGHATVEVRARAAVPPRQVWRVLADPWSWSLWVSGTRHIRGADADWPQPGTRLYHRFGPLPAQVRGHSTVLVAEPPVRLVLDACAWPWGRVWADLRLTAAGEATVITLREDAISGLVARFPRVGHAVQVRRNRRSLAALSERALTQSGGGDDGRGPRRSLDGEGE